MSPIISIPNLIVFTLIFFIPKLYHHLHLLRLYLNHFYLFELLKCYIETCNLVINIGYTKNLDNFSLHHFIPLFIIEFSWSCHSLLKIFKTCHLNTLNIGADVDGANAVVLCSNNNSKIFVEEFLLLYEPYEHCYWIVFISNNFATCNNIFIWISTNEYYHSYF